jgi:ribosome-associated translation inhibitor RaiA
VNGPKGGADKACRMDVTLTPGGTVRVEDVDPDLYVAIDRAAHRVNRSVARRLER